MFLPPNAASISQKVMRMPIAKGKCKLQFIVSDDEFNFFEMLRKKHFHETSKQKMLYNIFKNWMDKNVNGIKELNSAA